MPDEQAAVSSVADPVVADPVVADPVVADPVVADPVVADPVVADPAPDAATGKPAGVVETTPLPDIDPQYTREVAVEGLACLQRIYNFGGTRGAEVLEFLKRERFRVSKIEFTGIEVTTFQYDGDSVNVRTMADVQRILHEQKGI